VDATSRAPETSPPLLTGTLVVGLAPEHREQDVLARAVGDAALAELDRLVAVVVVEPAAFGWLSSERDGAAPDLEALRRRVRDRVVRRDGASPQPQVDVRVVEGGPVATLTAASAGSSGLYLGRGPARSLGPVVLGCACSARCPVTVVPRHEAAGPHGPVVVGLDDSQCARLALEHALAEGGRTGRPVLAISVLDGPGAGVGARPAPAAREEVRRAVEVRARSAVHDLLERRVRAHRPAVTIEVGVLEGPPAAVLCDVARRVGAALLVVGARGRGHTVGRRSPIGSVATRVVLRAPGAVSIVRESHR
jgi:nucleotide-binding universal stress UspA family protein